MTGYGRGESARHGLKITVEVKATLRTASKPKRRSTCPAIWKFSRPKSAMKSTAASPAAASPCASPSRALRRRRQNPPGFGPGQVLCPRPSPSAGDLECARAHRGFAGRLRRRSAGPRNFRGRGALARHRRRPQRRPGHDAANARARRRIPGQGFEKARHPNAPGRRPRPASCRAPSNIIAASCCNASRRPASTAGLDEERLIKEVFLFRQPLQRDGRIQPACKAISSHWTTIASNPPNRSDAPWIFFPRK